jgi:hypothetical protein
MYSITEDIFAHRLPPPITWTSISQPTPDFYAVLKLRLEKMDKNNDAGRLEKINFNKFRQFRKIEIKL